MDNSVKKTIKRNLKKFKNHKNKRAKKKYIAKSFDNPTDNDLYSALTWLFLDTDISLHYDLIIKYAWHFPIDYVEEALFKYVAPICGRNFYNFSGIIPISRIVIPWHWCCFDDDEVLKEIELLKAKEQKQQKTWFGRLTLSLRYRIMKHLFYKQCWEELKSHLKFVEKIKQMQARDKKYKEAGMPPVKI